MDEEGKALINNLNQQTSPHSSCASEHINNPVHSKISDPNINKVTNNKTSDYSYHIANTAHYHHLDVSQETHWQTLTEYIMNTFGRLDILINNAGITGFDHDLGPQDPEKTTLDAWHKIHSINLDGVFLGCKYGIQMMKSHGGSIVNMSSRSGIVGIPGACAYASSKAAVRNHTKSVALYCAEQKYNIRCNSIHPGAILTPMWNAMLDTDPSIRQDNIKNIANTIPLQTMGTPEDVAYAALYLASNESKYVTGIELNIDGGILAGSAASPKAE